MDQGDTTKRINLRRPDIMQHVTRLVKSHYHSPLVDYIRARGNILKIRDITFRLARQFGFCYGVERAIDMAYAATQVFTGKKIFILGEIIHNPEVNSHLKRLGVKFLTGTEKDADIQDVQSGDVVIIPAFGAETQFRQELENRGCIFVDTTCGDVMSVWKRVREYAKEGFTSIIHGKAWHEETRATCSQILASNGTYLVVYNLEETDYVCDYIIKGGDKHAFIRKFEGAHSPGFDPDHHLQRIGIANQTTMLRGETEEVQRRLREAILKKYGPAELPNRFKSFDTICGATQERQDALLELLETPLDLLIVIGGYNSSNTSHLAEIGETKLPTYFIKNASEILSDKLIRHYNLNLKKETETQNWLPPGPVTIGITAGASTPNNLVEETILKILQIRGVDYSEIPIPRTL